jgi:hypothetical protein
MIGKSAVSVKKLYQRAFLDAFPESLEILKLWKAVGDFTVFQDEFRRLAEQYQIAVYHELIGRLGLLSITAIAWASA